MTPLHPTDASLLQLLAYLKKDDNQERARRICARLRDPEAQKIAEAIMAPDIDKVELPANVRESAKSFLRTANRGRGFRSRYRKRRRGLKRPSEPGKAIATG